MLEPYSLQQVVQLDVDAQIVRVQLELVAGADAAIFVDVHRHGRDDAVVRDAPVPVAGGIGLIIDEDGLFGRLLSDYWFHGRALLPDLARQLLKLNSCSTILEPCKGP